MLAAILGDDAATPLSLYLDLEDGQIADIEVVSRAALAWAATLREIAFHLDPSMDIRVGLASGTPGSLSLNSIVKSIKKAKDEPVTFGALALLALLYFGADLSKEMSHRLVEKVVGEESQKVELSKEQIDQIGSVVAKSIDGNVAHDQVRQVYRELERDPAVRGVGVSRVSGARPSIIVPRSEFFARSGRTIKESAEAEQYRTVSTRMHVVLIRPILLAGERRWGFRGPTGEFGATIKDRNFVDSILSGATAIPMVAGIDMEIELEVREEFRGGVWVVVDRSVTHVFGFRRPSVTGDLFSAQHQNNQSSSGDQGD